MKIIFILLLSSIVYGRTTLEQIRFNKPTINIEYAKSIAILIDEAANKYKVPANVLAAIAMQESSYRLNAINSRSDDYGMFQINMFNIKAYGFNKNRLLTDLAYSVDCGAFIFAWFYKRYKLSESVRRYNCGTRKSCINWKGPRNYWKRVQKYM